MYIKCTVEMQIILFCKKNLKGRGLGFTIYQGDFSILFAIEVKELKRNIGKSALVNSLFSGLQERYKLKMEGICIMKLFWTKMFDYRGKMNRKDFWLGNIVNAILILVLFYTGSYLLGFVGGYSGAEEATFEAFSLLLFLLLFVVYFLAYLSAGVRRLRDAGFHPTWILATFVPILSIVLIVFFCLPTKEQ